MSIEFTIICDRCGTVVAASHLSAAHARSTVKAEGGKVGRRGGKDLCWECARGEVVTRG